MGWPLGPLLADVFMSKLERTTLREAVCSLHIYKRYVDDIVYVADETIHVDDILRQFNSAHVSVSFAIEPEVSDTLAFLDVQLIRGPESAVQRTIHRKRTRNGQYTHFASAVPMGHKRNVIR